MSTQSLLVNIKKDLDFKMYIHDNGQLFYIILNNQAMTIKEAIIESVQKFNIQRQLDLTQDYSLYEVYGARKSGKRKEDLPAFEKSQVLGQTCLKYFYLMPIYFNRKLQSKDSIKSIETQITMDSRPKTQVIQNSIFGCLCYRKGSMK